MAYLSDSIRRNGIRGATPTTHLEPRRDPFPSRRRLDSQAPGDPRLHFVALPVLRQIRFCPTLAMSQWSSLTPLVIHGLTG